MPARTKMFCCAPQMLTGTCAPTCPTEIAKRLAETEHPRIMVPMPADGPPASVLGQVVIQRKPPRGGN